MPTPTRSGQGALDQAVKEFLETQPSQGRPSAAGPKVQAAARASVRQARPALPLEESEALRVAYAGVLKHESEKAAAGLDAPLPLWRRLLMPGMLLLLVSASAYVWFGNPEWLAPPPHVALTPPVTPLSGQRQLVAVALEIDDFRRSTGRLPRDLGELGLSVPHISFSALPDMRYELRLGRGPHSLYYLGGPGIEPRIQTGGTP